MIETIVMVCALGVAVTVSLALVVLLCVAMYEVIKGVNK